jgi:hypothetical protein
VKGTSSHSSGVASVDVLIVGAGASGLMCAIEAGKRGLSVLLVDHSHKLAEKIRISGGGRCNFTNLNTKADSFLSRNPHFCRSALARFTPHHFIALIEKHGLSYSEKTLGQLFCDDGSESIIKLLKDECDTASVKLLLSCEIIEVQRSILPQVGSNPQTDLELPNRLGGWEFKVNTSRGIFLTHSFVIATGGLSIPKIGASPFGYKVAEQFGIPMTKVHPGLVPLSFHPEEWAPYSELAGVSIEAMVSCGKQKFRESLLFTHRGLSGPAILQISSYWEQGQPIHIDLLPDIEMLKIFIEHRSSKMMLDNFLTQYLPKRLAEILSKQFCENIPLNQLNQLSEKTLIKLANHRGC